MPNLYEIVSSSLAPADNFGVVVLAVAALIALTAAAALAAALTPAAVADIAIAATAPAVSW